MSRQSLRLRTTLVPVAVAAVTSAAVAFAAPEIGALPALGAGLLGVAAVAGAIWFLLAPLAKWGRVSHAIVANDGDASDFPKATGELHAIAEAFRKVERSREDLSERCQSDLDAMTAALSTLIDTRSTPVPPALVSPFPQQRIKLQTAFDDVSKDLQTGRQRLNLAMRVFNSLPDSVITVDVAGGIRFLNQTAEKLFGVQSAAIMRKPFGNLFAAPDAVARAGGDPERVVAGPDEATNWVCDGANGTVVVRTANNVYLELAGLTTQKGMRDALVCVVGRTLTEAMGREPADRMVIRANSSRQILDRYLGESEEPLRQIAAQFRLLVGDAKQSGLRDSMLPKLNTAGIGLKKLETYHTIAHWFRSLLWSNELEPTSSEFMAVEIANLVADRLQARLRSRGNSLKIIDQGGWLYADAEYLEVALLGVLLHACDATTNNQIELRIRKLPVDEDRATPHTEFQVLDAGPALTPDMLATLAQPFGSSAQSPLDQFAGIDGHPMGLVVADRLAPKMGGELRLEPNAGGQLRVWLTVPTRIGVELPANAIATVAPGALDISPYEEMVIGWRLGVPAGAPPA